MKNPKNRLDRQGKCIEFPLEPTSMSDLKSPSTMIDMKTLLCSSKGAQDSHEESKEPARPAGEVHRIPVGADFNVRSEIAIDHDRYENATMLVERCAGLA